MKITGYSHIHSQYSYDAQVPLRDIVTHAKKDGINFLCITEHVDRLSEESAANFIRDCHNYSSAECLVIPGFEIPYLGTHVLLIGYNNVPPHDGATAIVQARDSGAFVVVAHPHRNNFLIDDVLESSANAIEVWNSQYDGKSLPRARSISLLKKIRESAKPIVAFGGIDFHRYSHWGGPRIILETQEQTEQAVLSALKGGNFVIENRGVTVSSSAEFIGSSGTFLMWRGLYHRGVIWIGKRLGAVLSLFGFSLPRDIKEKIRTRI